MMRLTISQLARRCGLSRSTLLYYDRIGLLRAPDRTGSGYRVYGAADLKRLQRICDLRQAGLALADIRTMLAGARQPRAAVVERRLAEIGGQVRDLRVKQRVLTGMLRRLAQSAVPPEVNKQMWVEMLQAAGLNEPAMHRWHTEFERRAPDAHQDFLHSLGIPEAEIRRIRAWSR
jgi:MerR family transcriptional regulator, thiopeptide resistance regulator